MGAHNLPNKLMSDKAEFPVSGKALYIDGIGYMMFWGEGSPTDAETDAAPGALWHNLATGVILANYVNGGVNPTWVDVT